MVPSERLFSALVGGILGLGLVAGGFMRHRADRAGGRVSRLSDGGAIAALIGVAALAFYGAIVAYVVRPAWIGWSQVPLPVGVRVGGLVAAAVAIGGALWTLHHLGSNVTPTSAVRPDARLVTAGPYRWVRHPLYTCFAVLATGLTATTASWFLAAAVVLGWVVIVVRTRREEANLRARFGDDYVRYSERTGRFVPRSLGGGCRTS